MLPTTVVMLAVPVAGGALAGGGGRRGAGGIPRPLFWVFGPFPPRPAVIVAVGGAREPPPRVNVPGGAEEYPLPPFPIVPPPPPPVSGAPAAAPVPPLPLLL